MNRIEDHPILGLTVKGREVIIQVDGKSVPAFEGESIAAALLAFGIKVFRRTSRFDSPRNMFCGIGQCSDCSMIVNGIPNVRTCVTSVKSGMVVETQHGPGIMPLFKLQDRPEEKDGND
jgi:predicted molibdopterin-dependent oxidoreductase YjgC